MAISSGNVFVIGLNGQVQFIARGPDGLWGRWETTAATAMHIAHGGDVIGLIGPDGRVGALERGPTLTSCAWDLQATEIAATNLFGVGPALFARAADGKIWHIMRHADNPWSRWECLVGQVENIEATVIPGGGFAVFGIRDGVVSHCWQDRPLGPWNGWTDLGGLPGGAKCVRVASIKRGGLAIFAVDGDGALYHRWQDKPFGVWHDWQRLGEGVRNLSVTRAAAGGLAVFGLGTDDRVRCAFQTKRFGQWSQWIELGERAKAVAGQASYADGLEAFIIGQDDQVYHTWCARLDWPWTARITLDYEASPLHV